MKTICQIVHEKINYRKARNEYIDKLSDILFELIKQLKQEILAINFEWLYFYDGDKRYMHHDTTNNLRVLTNKLSLASELFYEIHSITSDSTLDLDKYKELNIDFENLKLKK